MERCFVMPREPKWVTLAACLIEMGSVATRDPVRRLQNYKSECLAVLQRFYPDTHRAALSEWFDTARL